jgi:hypothetical protein
VKCLEQCRQSQKCSILFAEVGKPKKRPPSILISNLEQLGLAHLEIITREEFVSLDAVRRKNAASNHVLCSRRAVPPALFYCEKDL